MIHDIPQGTGEEGIPIHPLSDIKLNQVGEGVLPVCIALLGSDYTTANAVLPWPGGFFAVFAENLSEMIFQLKRTLLFMA